MRKQFANTMLNVGADPKTIVLIGDISHHLLNEFEKAYPDRFYNLGIAEQSLIGIAAGLSIRGFRPYVHTIAPFCTERCFEQIKIDLCYQKLPATIISVGGSFDYSTLGCSHHCYEDVSILRTLPNISIYIPGNSTELDAIIKQTHNTDTPVYIKTTSNQNTLNILDFKIGEIYKIKDGIRGSVFCNGPIVTDILDIDYSIYYIPTLTPLSNKAVTQIKEAVKSNTNVISIEENTIIGGLGDLINDIISGINHKMTKIGIPNKFITDYGTYDELRKQIRLDPVSIKKRIHAING